MREARHSAAILKSTFNTIAEAVLVTDWSGAIVLSHPAAARIFQLKPATTLVDLENQNRIRAALDAPAGIPMTTPQL